MAAQPSIRPRSISPLWISQTGTASMAVVAIGVRVSLEAVGTADGAGATGGSVTGVTVSGEGVAGMLTATGAYATGSLGLGFSSVSAAEVWAQASEQVKADCRAANRHYDQYEGKVQDAAQKVNDAYLKAFQEEAGVKSYGAVADYLIAWYQAGMAG